MHPMGRHDAKPIRASLRPGSSPAERPQGRRDFEKSERSMKKPLEETAAAPSEASARGVDLSVVAALAQIAGRHDLSEVEIEHNGLRVRVARERRAAPVGYAMTIAPGAAAPPLETAAPAPVSPGDHPGSVKSPMVGTAYLRASPEAKPFVEIGSIVKAGDKLLLVEAMKTFNEIVAPKPGKVLGILVEDGTPVEYGQALMIVE
jgi:acetyl-CoA carboxylase biotin carboxyl carrier protein